MSSDTERRLRAALEASAELITEPPGSTHYQPPADNPDGADHPKTRRRRRLGPWVAPLLAAAAVALVSAGVTAIVRTVNTHEDAPVSHRSSSPVTASPSPKPSPTSTSTARQQPLPGPQVVDAKLFAGGRGYALTPHSLLWTDNQGATWRNISPPGLTQVQLQSVGIAALPDGHQWVAAAPKAGISLVTLLRRSSTTQAWTSTSIALGALTISPDAGVTTSLSFTDANNGWLLVSEQITHTGFGELLRTTDGGANWTLRAGQRSLPAIGAIHFLTPTIGYLDANSAVGAGWWATHDAGQTWTQLQLPTPAANKSDLLTVISAPTLAGDAIVLAASFTTPTQGNDEGVGIYRSTDGGATWTIHQLPSKTPTEQYNFAATADGSSYVLLRSQPAADFQSFTWVTSHSTDAGQSFTDTTSVHNSYPGALTLADPDNLWTIGGANGCKSFKTDCWNTAGLIASNDAGASWHQVKLPS